MRKAVVLIGVAMLFFVLGCLKTTGAAIAADEVIKLRYSNFLSPSSTFTPVLKGWCTEVEKRTKGRVKITMYDGGTLMPPQQAYDGVTKGVADIAYGIFSYHRGRFPLLEVIDLPLGAMDPALGPRMANALYKKFKPKELDDVKVLFLDASGPGVLGSKKAITKLSDIRGMKVRSHGVSGRIAKALGGSPVGIPVTEAYDAMSKGVIDAILMDQGAFHSFGFDTVVKNHLVTPAVSYYTGFYIAMNKDKWNSLPPDIKTIIDQINEEWIEKIAQARIEWIRMGVEAAHKHGIKITYLSKEDSAAASEKVRSILDEYVKAAKAKGLPGEEALKFCQDYIKAHEKK